MRVGARASTSRQLTPTKAPVGAATTSRAIVPESLASAGLSIDTTTVPVAPTPAPQQTGFDGYFQDFLYLRPPTYSGSGMQEDPHGFLDRLDDIFRILQCSDSRRTELVIFQLLGNARDWYNQLMNIRPANALL